MSEYYNITLFNEVVEEPTQIFRVNQNSFQPILDNQSNYQVGVKRFKLPAGEIDFYRIYPNKQIMGVGVNTNLKKLSGLTYGQLGTQYQIYTDHYDNDENSHYTLIRSNNEYASALTRAYNRGADTNMTYRHQLTQTTTGDANIGYMELTSAIGAMPSPLGQYMMGTPVATLTGAIYAGATKPNATAGQMAKVCVYWEVDITAISSTSTEVLSNFMIGIAVDSKYPTQTGTDPNKQVFVPIFNNFGVGKIWSDVASIFPNGLKISSGGEVMFNTKTNTTGNKPHFYPNNDLDLEAILMTYGEYSKYNLTISDNSNGGSANTTITGTFTIRMSNDPGFRYGANVNGSVIGTSQNYNTDPPSTYPRFIFDEASQRLALMADPQIKNQMLIYASPQLLNSVGFDSVKFNYVASGVSVTNIVTLTGLPINGAGILSFKSVEGINQAISGPQLYYEPELSVFKRNFVYGILITTNNLSISGEFMGKGTSKLNILSDFEIDPSTNFRDYYIFQPEGNSVRYYNMKSTSDLYGVTLSVFYVDMNDNIKPFLIGSGMKGSVKLHFRPRVNDSPN